MDGSLTLNDPLAGIALPHNSEAEQALLGSILVRNENYERVADFLRPEHFAEAIHARIYTAIGKLIDQGSLANPVTLKNLFERDDALTEIGGAAYLVRLAVSAVTFINAADYGRTILDCWQRRQIIAAAADTIERAGRVSLERDAPAIIVDLEQQLYGIAESRSSGAAVVDAGTSARAAISLAEEAYKNGGRLLGLATGLVDLDKLLGGLQPKLFYLLAGRPSMGKSALAHAIAVAAAEQEARDAEAENRPARRVLFLSLEMSHVMLTRRCLAARTRIELEKIKYGRLSAAEWTALNNAAARLDRLPLDVDDSRGLSAAEIRTRARRWARGNGLALIVVDHIQKIRASKETRSNETAAITEISGALQCLAGDLGVPVLALSQLSREVERRDDKRPGLSDLRQSGALEQDADVVMLVYREEYYLRRNVPTRRDGEDAGKFNDRYTAWEERVAAAANKAEVIVAKHRDGPIGSVHAFFDGSRAVFENLEQGDLPI